MKFRVIGTAKDGARIDQIMEADSASALRKLAEANGIRVHSMIDQEKNELHAWMAFPLMILGISGICIGFMIAIVIVYHGQDSSHSTFNAMMSAFFVFGGFMLLIISSILFFGQKIVSAIRSR